MLKVCTSATIILLAASSVRANISLTGVGAFGFASNPTAPELSGISYVSGNQFYAISDNNANLYSLRLSIDPNTGAITSGSVDSSPLALKDSSGTPYASGSTDFEGVAYDPVNHSVYVSDELGPTIHQQSLTSGNQTLQITPASAAELNVFANIRSNAGWESMSRQPDGSTLWTANQEPLTNDGAKAKIYTPAPIRLQRFNSSMTPTGQFAYQLDVNDAESGWNSMSVSCVSDLLTLADGEVVALERATGTGGSHNADDMRIRLYLIDPSHATDLAGASSIGSATYVTKTLLWEDFFDAEENNQFEGITLGPTLANGDQSVIMVADNGGGNQQQFYSLRLSGVPEPSSVALLAGSALFALRRRRSR